MTNPISVLLIIGAAVVGPIEAQWDIPKNAAPNCVGSEAWKDKEPGRFVICGGLETIPQLCERAMREIGAELFRGTPAAALEQHLAGMSVRCIPTPQGYRK